MKMLNNYRFSNLMTHPNEELLHTVPNNLSLCIKTEPVWTGADVVVYVHTVKCMPGFWAYYTCISGSEPDIYRWICSYRDRLPFYVELHIIFGTVYRPGSVPTMSESNSLLTATGLEITGSQTGPHFIYVLNFEPKALQSWLFYGGHLEIRDLFWALLRDIRTGNNMKWNE